MPTKAKKKEEITLVPEMPAMVVTGVQVFLIKEPMGKTQALARVVLNEALQLTGLRVIDGVNGNFVSYPNDPGYSGKEYRSIFYPITRELRDLIENAVLAKYDEAKKAQAEAQG